MLYEQAQSALRTGGESLEIPTCHLPLSGSFGTLLLAFTLAPSTFADNPSLAIGLRSSTR